MFCGNCGNEVADGMKFCKKCGSPVAADNPPHVQTTYNNNVSQAAGNGYSIPVSSQDNGNGIPVKPKKKKTAAIVITAAALVLIAGAAVLVFLLFVKGGHGGCKDPEDLPSYYGDAIRNRDIKQMICTMAPEEYWESWLEENDKDFSDLKRDFPRAEGRLNEVAEEAEEEMREIVYKCYDDRYLSDKDTVSRLNGYLQEYAEDLEVEECYDYGDYLIYCVDGSWYYGSKTFFYQNSRDYNNDIKEFIDELEDEYDYSYNYNWN